MNKITRAIIIGGWIVIGLAVAVIWPFVALCSVLAGVALFFVSHLLRLAKGHPAPTNNHNNRGPIMANRKYWRVTASAILATHDGITAADLHNGIELDYVGERLQIDDLECTRLLPNEPAVGEISDNSPVEYHAVAPSGLSENECVEHLRALGFDVHQVDDLQPDQQVRPHNTIEEIVEAMADAFKVSKGEMDLEAVATELAAAKDVEGGDQ